MSEKIAHPCWLRPVDGALRALSHLAGMTDLEVPALPGGRTDKAGRTSVSVLDLDWHRYLVFGWSGARLGRQRCADTARLVRPHLTGRQDHGGRPFP